MEPAWLRMSAVIAPMIPLLREVACWDGMRCRAWCCVADTRDEG